ncbi:MAG: serpin family protein [Bacteroidales bacterium]|nr:serpin family protein [Bacteroidales bacterium]
MKKIVISFAAGLAALFACTPANEDSVKDPITISSPAPSEQITKVGLTETQKGYVDGANMMAFRLMKQLYEGSDMICSPLSLQYALAMTANGASGETLQEIIDFLGYGADGIDALNEYCKILMEQLPAVSLQTKLKVTNALLVNNEFPLLPSFQKTVEENYYAAVENMDFTNPALIASRINDWAKRNTDGFINKVLEPDDIHPLAAAFLMNALYFKAKWAGSDYDPMFTKEGTYEDNFNLTGTSSKKVKYMQTVGDYKYAEFDDFTVLALPFQDYKYYMYFLLPRENNLGEVVGKLTDITWSDIKSALKNDAEVHVKLPKFDIENKYELSKALTALGVKRAFDIDFAEFHNMFQPKPGFDYAIASVIQKAKISVAEWGTEAAAVTVVQMYAEGACPPEEHKIVWFVADHPFAFFIEENTSNTILFEGTFTGK